MNSKSRYPFLSVERLGHIYRPIRERVKDFKEVEMPVEENEIRQQASRCMNCGIPFCHGKGCPLGNLIPDMNDAVNRGDPDILHVLVGAAEVLQPDERASRLAPDGLGRRRQQRRRLRLQEREVADIIERLADARPADRLQEAAVLLVEHHLAAVAAVAAGGVAPLVPALDTG